MCSTFRLMAIQIWPHPVASRVPVMPRLKVHDGPQQGRGHWCAPRAWRHARTRKKRKKEEPPEQPLGADRARRSRAPGKRQRLSADQQALMLVEYYGVQGAASAEAFRRLSRTRPHSTVEKRIEAHLPAPMRRGKQVGPEIKVVPQCAQSPETNTLDLG